MKTFAKYDNPMQDAAILDHVATEEEVFGYGGDRNEKGIDD